MQAIGNESLPRSFHQHRTAAPSKRRCATSTELARAIFPTIRKFYDNDPETNTISGVGTLVPAAARKYDNHHLLRATAAAVRAQHGNGLGVAAKFINLPTDETQYSTSPTDVKPPRTLPPPADRMAVRKNQHPAIAPATATNARLLS